MYMTVRLSRVLLERLPPDIGFELMDMLPESLCLRDPEWDELKNAAASEPDLTLGYQDLVETAEHSLMEPMSAPSSPDFFQRAVDFFLWAFAMELGLELKERIAGNLPVDLRTRMNLFSGFAEEAKVA